MTANNRFLILFTVAVALSSCATNSFRSKTYRNMLVASAVGLAMGQQKEESKVGYSMAYAGTLAAVAAIASIEYYDSDKEKRELDAKLKFINEMELRKTKSITEDLPEDLKNLIETHYYDVYRINRWTQRGPNLLVKESEAIELKGVKSNEE